MRPAQLGDLKGGVRRSRERGKRERGREGVGTSERQTIDLFSARNSCSQLRRSKKLPEREREFRRKQRPDFELKLEVVDGFGNELSALPFDFSCVSCSFRLQLVSTNSNTRRTWPRRARRNSIIASFRSFCQEVLNVAPTDLRAKETQEAL